MGPEFATANRACPLGQQWFDAAWSREKRLDANRLYFVDQQPVDLQTAIESAAKLLNDSTSPLICGLDGLTTQAQQAAWRLADRIGATIDTTWTNSGRASQFSLQRNGQVTATLGEIAMRSDLIVFWFCDPVKTHPRHLERYSCPENGPARKVIVIDDSRTSTADEADEFIEISKIDTAAAIATLRALIANHPPDDQRVKASTGHPGSTWKMLADQLVGSRYGALFYGSTTLNSDFDLDSDSLASLVRELNQKTRFVSLPMRIDVNAQSAENVLAWSSGFPFAINLNRRFPRSQWLHHSAQSVLQRGECDLILAASTRQLESALSRLRSLDSAAADHFEKTKKILVCETEMDAISQAAVRFTVATPGWSGTGDFCRQDDVSLPLDRILNDVNLVGSRDIFEALLASVTIESSLNNLRDEM